jgi:PPOX class probable F420-dependent enzyme
MAVSIDDAIAFTRDNHRAVLATRRRDGRPQLSPVTVAPGETGEVIISTRETAMKVKNIERDPHVSLCVFTDAFFGAHVQIDGEVDVVRLPDAMEGLVDYYRSVSGEHPDWDDYRAAMVRDRRVLLRIRVTDAGPNTSG